MKHPRPVRRAAIERVAEWQGLDQLETKDVIALLLGGSTAHHRKQAESLLHAVGEPSRLVRFTPEGLAQLASLTTRQALVLLSALELGWRVHAQPRRPPPLGALTKERVAEWAVPALGRLEHEEVWALTVDARAGLRSRLLLGRGGAHGCALLPRDILTPVVRAGALGFVLVHNHPSGDPRPSPEDVALTNAVQRASGLIGTPLLDHVIVAGSDYLSLRDEGLLAA